AQRAIRPRLPRLQPRGRSASFLRAPPAPRENGGHDEEAGQPGDEEYIAERVGQLENAPHDEDAEQDQRDAGETDRDDREIAGLRRIVHDSRSPSSAGVATTCSAPASRSSLSV